jgi:hypothetical protein
MKFVIDRPQKLDAISRPQMDELMSQRLGISGIKTGATAVHIIIEHDLLTNDDFPAIQEVIDSYNFDPDFGRPPLVKSLEERLTELEARITRLENGDKLSGPRI